VRLGLALVGGAGPSPRVRVREGSADAMRRAGVGVGGGESLVKRNRRESLGESCRRLGCLSRSMSRVSSSSSSSSSAAKAKGKVGAKEVVDKAGLYDFLRGC
jgi:hypothetical protein